MKLLTIVNSTRLAEVDDKNFERLSRFRWHDNGLGHIQRCYWAGKPIQVSLANEILQVSGMIDHKDRDSYNNLESNLRPCTWSQNQGNTKKYSGTSSKYKGVSWHRSNRHWIANIVMNGLKKHLGYFDDEIDAASAYNKATLSYFGEFANLNKDENGNVL